jgi:hypothetical protein
MRSLKRVVAGFAAAVATVAFAVPASADTVQIGSTLGHAAAAPNGELCTNCVGG